MSIFAIGAATFAWFIVAGILFFNPITDKIYRSRDHQPGVRVLPPNPKSIGMILAAIVVQIILWALVFHAVKGALPIDKLTRGLSFGLILIATKMIPRDADRILLSTYPSKRMAIEFVIGCVSMMVVGIVFGYLI